MEGAHVRAAAAALVVASAIAILGLRACGRAEVAPAGAPLRGMSADAPRDAAPRPRAEAPVPPPEEPRPVEPPPPPPSDVSPEFAAMLHRPDPLVVTVTCRGRPVAECRFGIVRDDVARDVEDGWRIDAARPGRYEVEIAAGESFPVTIAVDAPGWSEIRVAAASRDRAVDVRLPEGGTVAGVVRLASGAAIPRARVVLAGRTATSGDDGRVLFEDVALGRHTEAHVSTGAMLRTVSCDVELTQPGASRDVAFVVPDTASLRVRVVRASDGIAVPGVSVAAWESDGGAASRVKGTTGADGRVSLDGVRPGEYQAAVRGEGIEPVHEERLRAPSDEEVEIRVKPYRPWHAWGRVVDAKGRPVRGASIRFSTNAGPSVCPETAMGSVGGAETGADGRFDCVPGQAPPHLRLSFQFEEGWEWFWIDPERIEWTIRVDRGDLGSREFTIRRNVRNEESTLVWRPAVTLTGTVRDAAGAPLEEFWVCQITDDGQSESERVGVPRKSAEMHFEARGFASAPGEVVLYFGEGRSWSTRLTPRASGATDLGTIVLPPATRVRFANGDASFTRPLLVREWNPATGAATEFATCHASGEWISEESVASGRRRLLVWTAGRLAADAGEIDVIAGATTDIAARLLRPSDVVVHVRRGDRVIAGAAVVVSPVDPPPCFEFLRTVGATGPRAAGRGMALSTKSDAHGRAWVSRLPAGGVRMTVTDPESGASQQLVAELREGETTGVDVDLAR